MNAIDNRSRRHCEQGNLVWPWLYTTTSSSNQFPHILTETSIGNGNESESSVNEGF